MLKVLFGEVIKGLYYRAARLCIRMAMAHMAVSVQFEGFFEKGLGLLYMIA